MTTVHGTLSEFKPRKEDWNTSTLRNSNTTFLLLANTLQQLLGGISVLFLSVTVNRAFKEREPLLLMHALTGSSWNYPST